MLSWFRAPAILIRLVILSSWSFQVTSGSDVSEDLVRKILRTHCVGCHNNVDREGGVSLLSAATIREGSDNGPLLNREDVSHSRLLGVLESSAELSMPPDGEPQLSSTDRQQLRQWVLQGAPLTSVVTMPQVPEIVVNDAQLPLLASVRISDSDVCVGGIDRIVRLNASTEEQTWEVSAGLGKVSQLSASADSRLVIAACGTPGVGGQAVLMNAQDGSIVRRFTGHSDAVYSAVIDASAVLIATAGYDRNILLHDVSTGEVVRTMTGHNGSIFDLAFDPSGKILCSASADGTVKVWSVETGQRLDTMSQPQAEQYCVAVSRDGSRIVAAGADNRIRIWSLVSLESAQINPLKSSTFGHEQAITSLALSPGGSRLATAAEDGTVRVWSIGPLQQLGSLPRQQILVSSLKFISERQLLMTRMDGTFQVFSVPEESSDMPSPEVARTKLPDIVNIKVPLREVSEVEDNDTVETAHLISLPASVRGTIHQADRTDVDCFQFHTDVAEPVVLEIFAASEESPLDSVIEILNLEGAPVLRTQLQAVRDSWFTFRGKDSTTSDDFRVFYWQEMELNDFLYSDGEVVRLWHYPRGPDSGFRVYPGFGSRHTWFGTTPTAHALQAPCYVVVPRAAGEELTPNGLPVFPVYYRNDDDPQRLRGSDSRLLFTAPEEGNWIVRVSDARGFHGEDFKYELRVRSPKPGFHVTHNGGKLALAPGAGREIEFIATREDWYTGAIAITAENLPQGLRMSGDVVIEPHQLRAYATVYSVPDAMAPTADQIAKLRFHATAEINGEMVDQELSPVTEISIAEDSKLVIHIESQDGQRTSVDEPLTLKVHPGETISAVIRLDRHDAAGIVSFGKDESGRNLPHGVFVDNIGLNGLLMPAGTVEREFFLTAAPIVQPGRRMFFLKSSIDGLTSLPVILDVQSAADGAAKPVAVR